MAKSTTPIPPGFHSLTPHLIVEKGAAKYIDFLKLAFGATELGRAPGPGGKLMHVLMQVGDSMLMFNDYFPDMCPPLASGNSPVILSLYVPDVDAAWAKAVAAGCEVTFPLADQFWGDRYGQVNDPFGFTWALATHKEDLTPAEIDQRMAKSGGAGGGA